MSQAQPQAHTLTQSITQLFDRLLTQNPNLPQTKASLRSITDMIQLHTYRAFTGTEEEYLQTCGLSYHEEEMFHYINSLLHVRTTDFLDKIQENQVKVKSTIPPPPPPPEPVPASIVNQVEEILKNVDLPLSLFKRNDQYWSQDNPKTQQVKQYLRQLHQQDRKWKGQIKKKRQEIVNSKNQSQHKHQEENHKLQERLKEEEKIKMSKNIQFYKSQASNRKKTIEESLEFMKKQGRPLFKKMEEEYHNKIELPTLEEKKRKLSQVRNLRKSVDLIEIQAHRQKCQKLRQEHQQVTIHNQPVKVSFKGSFHKSLQKSRMDEMTSQSRYKTLVDRKTQFSRIVKQKYKPAIDQEKADQIAQRIQLMNRRFTRVKKGKKYNVEDEDQQEEEEEEPEPQPEPSEQEEEEEDDEDQEGKVKDDQYDPDRSERYKMGLRYLQQARKRRKKVQSAPKSQQQQSISQSRNASKSFSMANVLQTPHLDSSNLNSNQSSRKIKYRNYLHQMSKTNRTIDQIDTSRIKKQFTSDMKLRKSIKLQQIENQLRTVDVKTRNEEELLKYERGRKGQALNRKQELDNVILDTIKARLALMKNQ